MQFPIPLRYPGITTPTGILVCCWSVGNTGGLRTIFIAANVSHSDTSNRNTVTIGCTLKQEVALGCNRQKKTNFWRGCREFKG